MSWPNANHFGIVENPIIVSPYFENDSEETEFPANDFLLLGHEGVLLLLGGGNFLLLGAI